MSTNRQKQVARELQGHLQNMFRIRPVELEFTDSLCFEQLIDTSKLGTNEPHFIFEACSILSKVLRSNHWKPEVVDTDCGSVQMTKEDCYISIQASHKGVYIFFSEIL